MPRPLVTAHSGCLGTPDNSREHLAAARDAGADFAEVDLRLGAGGSLVLAHDPVVGPGALPLAEVWDEFRGWGLGWNLDVKDRRALAPLAAFLRDRGGDRVVVTGCGASWVVEWRSLLPSVPVLFNVEVGPGPREDRADWEDRIVAEARHCGAAGLNADHRLVNASLEAKARWALLPLFVWTIDDETDLAAWVARGPSGITTNRVDRAHHFLTGF